MAGLLTNGAMVKKIKKKVKKGPAGIYAVPMAMVLTGLYGLRLEGRDLRRRFESPGEIREVLASHLGNRVQIAERLLSPDEYRDWEYRMAPARAAERFSGFDFIPAETPIASEETARPSLGVLPLVALMKGRGVGPFLKMEPAAFSEINHVCFQNAVSADLNLIPGYDQLLYAPPVHAKQLNGAIGLLDAMARDAFDKGDVPYPGPFEKFDDRDLSGIPVSEPFSD